MIGKSQTLDGGAMLGEMLGEGGFLNGATLTD
jgi:hypothetical protein